jgi:hypothetical protein
MKILKVIKWSAFILSVSSFSIFFALTTFYGEEIKSDFQQQDTILNNEEENMTGTEQSLNEEVLNYEETDCEGIINAFENQQDKKVENFPEGLLFNYQSCIKYGKPGNANQEKQEINKKSNNSQKDKSKKERKK